jgi:type II secretory pathway component GspD/PulD (secretin)
MTLKQVFSTAALTLTLVAPFLRAQPTEPSKPADTPSTSPDYAHRMEADLAHSQVKTFYISNASNRNEAGEILVELRNTFPPYINMSLDATQNAIVVNATPEQLVQIQALIHDLDRPHKTYRITYTLTDIDSGKRVGTQHFSMVVVPRQQSVLKQGSKIPVATGSSSTPNAVGAETQFTYLDVGINLQATVEEIEHGVSLDYKVEQSNLGEAQTIAGVQEPVIRQTVVSGTSILTLNKPTILGSADILGSTRHTDVEVVLEQIP